MFLVWMMHIWNKCVWFVCDVCMMYMWYISMMKLWMYDSLLIQPKLLNRLQQMIYHRICLDPESVFGYMTWQETQYGGIYSLYTSWCQIVGSTRQLIWNDYKFTLLYDASLYYIFYHKNNRFILPLKNFHSKINIYITITNCD